MNRRDFLKAVPAVAAVAGVATVAAAAPAPKLFEWYVPGRPSLTPQGYLYQHTMRFPVGDMPPRASKPCANEPQIVTFDPAMEV